MNMLCGCYNESLLDYFNNHALFTYIYVWYLICFYLFIYLLWFYVLPYISIQICLMCVNKIVNNYINSQLMIESPSPGKQTSKGETIIIIP